MIKEGLAADLCVWRIEHPAELSYWTPYPGPERMIIGGKEERS
jgi:imidazolonepropionase-like amidohydrolase